MARPRIILFRRSQPADAFEDVFQDIGWETHAIPVLAFDKVNEQLFTDALNNPDLYGGIIVTSPRAGDLLGHHFEQHDALCKAWQTKPIVCIGKRTAERLIACKHVPYISDRARSEAVAEKVMALDESRPWLFICGNLRRDELPDTLTRVGIAFEELVVYQTKSDPDLALPADILPDWVVFFSPSGVRAVHPLWFADWRDVRIAAIGTTTAKAIEEVGWEVDAVAEKPEPTSIKDAVLAALVAE